MPALFPHARTGLPDTKWSIGSGLSGVRAALSLNPNTTMSDTSVPVPPPPAAPAGEDKTVAILAYVTPILCYVGIVIAIVMHNKAKTKLGAFHLRQSLGLIIGGVACFILSLIPLLGLVAAPLLGLAIFVLWIMGLLAAINGEQKPVPVVGEQFAKWFATVFE